MDEQLVWLANGQRHQGEDGHHHGDDEQHGEHQGGEVDHGVGHVSNKLIE